MFEGFWEPRGTNFGVISMILFVIWTTQLRCGFQSSFFCDLGVDRAPGCDAWMCLKHGKYNGFGEIYTLRKVWDLGVPGEALGTISGGFRSPLGHFFPFFMVLEGKGILMDFWWFPGGPQILSSPKLEGKSPGKNALLSTYNYRQQTAISNLRTENC